MNKEAIIESSGNIFTDLGFSPEEVTLLTMRAELMVRIREAIKQHQWTQNEAAERLGVGQSRISDLIRGKKEKFSLDMLITLATRAGERIGLSYM